MNLDAPPRALLLLCTIVLVGCGVTPAAAPSPSTVDPFAGVRARAETAYEEGQGQLAQGDLEGALISFDEAFVQDPDNRPDIQAALNQTLDAIRALPSPSPAATSIAQPATPPPATPFPFASQTVAQPSPSAAASFDSGSSTYRDSQGRFSLASPKEWQTRDKPQTAFGAGVVSFNDPAQIAEVSIAVDQQSQAVSPELYAARMDLAMQQVSGYALDGAIPFTLSNTPALRRDFTAAVRDSYGNSITERSTQVVALHGGTAFILTASAPASDFQRFSAAFSTIISSFTFG